MPSNARSCHIADLHHVADDNDGRVAGTAMLSELTDILGRRKFDDKIAASGPNIDQLVDGYAQLASVVHPLPVPRIAPDPMTMWSSAPHSQRRPN